MYTCIKGITQMKSFHKGKVFLSLICYYMGIHNLSLKSHKGYHSTLLQCIICCVVMSDTIQD